MPSSDQSQRLPSPPSPERRHLNAFAIVALGVLFVLGFTSGYGWLIWTRLGSWEAGGSFGDSFGLANALFAGLAFVGLLATILLQQRDLDLQRRELERTREELKRAAEAQEKALQAQKEAIKEQQKSRAYAEYLAVQSDFSSSMRTFISGGSHTTIYDDLAARGGSKFVGWENYTPADKATYAYLELVYETFERVFVILKEGWIPATEWPYWERWVDDVAGHPIIEHVHEDNEGMFDEEFESYFRERIRLCRSRQTSQTLDSPREP